MTTHEDQRSRDLAYLKEMGRFLARRERRKDKAWTESDRDEYNEIWAKHHPKKHPSKSN